MNDFEVELVDDYDGDYCGDCGHFHVDDDCPPRDELCGDYRCCIN